MKAIFECYGYETVQDGEGLRLMVNVALNIQGKLRHIKHVFIDDEEIIQFFKSTGGSIDYTQIPRSHGLCEVTAVGELEIITHWYEKEKEEE